jgi:hypothetical protein
MRAAASTAQAMVIESRVDKASIGTRKEKE